MSYKVYPVIQQNDVCKDYKVFINGKEIDLNTARVSAVPFNRRWPGHQRDISQSELINFVSLETDEKLEFEVVCCRSFESVNIRPLESDIVPDIQNNTIRFTLPGAGYYTVEPFGRNRALHIFADSLSSYDIDKNDENVLYYGPGEHMEDMIYLKDNQTLFIDEGAVVYACIKADDAKNIKIMGRGILDNSRNKEVILFEANEEGNDTAVRNAKRTHTIQLNYCKDIEIDGITIRDSLVYNIRPIACENMTIKNIKIIGSWRYNADGIDMHNCENVLIDNCFIRTFDDSICIKGFDPYGNDEGMERDGKVYDTFKNVVVTNCVVWNDWNKSLEFGAETQAEEICNVVFKDCHVIHVTGEVLDCANVDYADIHNVYYENISVEYDDVIPDPVLQKKDSEVYTVTDPDYAPPLIAIMVYHHHEYSAPGSRRGKNHDFRFKNIRLYGRQKPVILTAGYSNEFNTQDVTVEDLYWNGDKITGDEYIKADMYSKNIKLI